MNLKTKAMKIVRIPLQPFSRFHFGAFKIDVNLGLSSTSLFAHSDTLFSALVNSYAQHIDNADNFVKAFKKSALIISSLFYYLKKKDKQILFLPKPVFLETDSKIDGMHKVRNKVKFVSLDVWRSGFHQEDWPDETKYTIIQDECVVTKKEYDELIIDSKIKNVAVFKVTQSPKSPIRKNAPNDAIFYQTDIEIADNGIEIETGFYFMYESDDKAELMLKDATNVMSKSGIGGERNNMGRIMGDPVFEELDLGINSDSYTNISLICPVDLSEFNKIEFYKLITRGGRHLEQGADYKVVRLIQEGAKLTDKIKGKLIEIGIDDNNKPAVRNGKAFLIPVIL